jgi:hypothetical protein
MVAAIFETFAGSFWRIAPALTACEVMIYVS